MTNVIENQKNQVFSKIESYEKDYLLNVPESELLEFLKSEYLIEEIGIFEDKIEITERDVLIDKSRDFRYGERAFNVPGIEITFHIPFYGENILFSCTPAGIFEINPPRGNIGNNEILCSYKVANKNEDDEKRMNSDFEQNLSKIKDRVLRINQNILNWNNSLENLILEKIKSRKEKFNADNNLIKSLKYPLKKNPNQATTYKVPEIRKKPKITEPKITKKPFQAEPELDILEYNEIIKIIQSMNLMMERTPETFSKLKEEEIRNHILFNLNSHYEGSATGETFNGQGKTDILIRKDNKNLFIGECKIWKGEKVLHETIDQIAKYTTWRDTKTAIIFFNKNKSTTKVIETITSEIRNHNLFDKVVEKQDFEVERVLMKQINDPERKIYLTFLVFDVPNKKN